MTIRYLAVLSACALVMVAGLSSARADDPDFLAFQVGAFDFIQGDDSAGAFAMEYRFDERLWIFKPFGGMMGTTDGALHVYGGILLDVFFGRRVVFTLGFAPGLYHDSTGKDLGSAIEFRSSGEIAYRLDNRSRIGVMVNHVSNAGIDDRNPGTEILMLTYAIALD